MAKRPTGVRLKQRDLKELETLAKKEDETVSSLIRQAIREFLDKKVQRAGNATHPNQETGNE